MTARRTTIVCFSNLDWNYLRYRKQHLMSRLSRRFDVIYVNPPRALKARQPWRWNRVSRPGDHLWVLEPLVLPGVRNTPALKRVTDQLIARAIARIPVAPGPAIAWAYSPHALGLVDLIQPHFVVYDIADNYTTPGGAMVRDANERDEIARLEALEDRMLRRADLVLCVSEPLAARARRLHQDVHVIPNGCDFSAYHQVSAPPNLRPRIGYVGTIAPRVDVDLLVGLATARPDWDIDVVGPVSPLVTIDRAAARPNLLWRGEIPYEAVPSTIARFDVGILPLREIPFSNDCSPIQVFDYLAAGKPIVSTPVTQLRQWPSLVRTARGVDAFVRAIEASLAERTDAHAAARRRFASANSWDARVDDIVTLLIRSGGIPLDLVAA